MKKSGKIISLFLLLAFLLNGCLPKKKMVYISESQYSRQISDFKNVRTSKKIEPYDQLYIQVLSLDETTSRIFNDANRNIGTQIEILSYEVSDSGFIDFPFLGKIYLKDMTIYEAKQKIENQLSQYVQDIAVKVKFVGNDITVLGEVSRQGNYIFYEDKLPVFKAIGLAGGINDFGNKQEIILIREKDNIINYYTIDLTSKNVVEKDLYYILPNDVIIVQPIRAKFKELQNFDIERFALTTLTTLITLLYFLERQ